MSLARCLVALLAARVGASTHLFLPVSYARAFVGRWRPQTFGGQLLSSSATVAAYTRAIMQLTRRLRGGAVQRSRRHLRHAQRQRHEHIASVIWGHEHAPTLDISVVARGTRSRCPVARYRAASCSTTPWSASSGFSRFLTRETFFGGHRSHTHTHTPCRSDRPDGRRWPRRRGRASCATRRWTPCPSPWRAR